MKGLLLTLTLFFLFGCSSTVEKRFKKVIKNEIKQEVKEDNAKLESRIKVNILDYTLIDSTEYLQWVKNSYLTTSGNFASLAVQIGQDNSSNSKDMLIESGTTMLQYRLYAETVDTLLNRLTGRVLEPNIYEIKYAYDWKDSEGHYSDTVQEYYGDNFKPFIFKIDDYVNHEILDSIILDYENKIKSRN